MKIGIVTPAPVGSRSGNRVTAIRWARILRALGHQVDLSESYKDEQFDLLIALHAIRSKEAIKSFNNKYPNKPIIVALTGTDIYATGSKRDVVRQSLKMATRIVALQKMALAELESSERRRAVVIHQSVAKRGLRMKPGGPDFTVCVVGHLREVKDPFRTAMASRLLPEASRIRVIQAGRAMNPVEQRRAQTEMKKNSRYEWLGEVTAARVRTLFARSHLFVLSSKVEGGVDSDLPLLSGFQLTKRFHRV